MSARSAKNPRLHSEPLFSCLVVGVFTVNRPGGPQPLKRAEVNPSSLRNSLALAKELNVVVRGQRSSHREHQHHERHNRSQ